MRSRLNPTNTPTSLLLGLAALIACAAQAACGQSQTPSGGAPAPNVVAPGPSIEGTYTLVSRHLPNGTKQVPPDILGLLTYTKEYRNFNVYWKDAGGKAFSISAMATYTLTDKEYTEKTLYYLVNDEVGGKGVSYDLSRPLGTGPVSVKERRIEIQLPLHGEPAVVFEGDTLTATRKDAFVDHWEKVK
jgi:hypothetical protein